MMQGGAFIFRLSRRPVNWRLRSVRGWVFQRLALERIMKEIRRRTRVVGAFPDGHSALMLCAARLRHVAGTQWGSRRYLNMDLLREQDLDQNIDLVEANKHPVGTAIMKAKDFIRYQCPHNVRSVHRTRIDIGDFFPCCSGIFLAPAMLVKKGTDSMSLSPESALPPPAAFSLNQGLRRPIAIADADPSSRACLFGWRAKRD